MSDEKDRNDGVELCKIRFVGDSKRCTQKKIIHAFRINARSFCGQTSEKKTLAIRRGSHANVKCLDDKIVECWAGRIPRVNRIVHADGFAFLLEGRKYILDPPDAQAQHVHFLWGKM
jgi:hypothetical protein